MTHPVFDSEPSVASSPNKVHGPASVGIVSDRPIETRQHPIAAALEDDAWMQPGEPLWRLPGSHGRIEWECFGRYPNDLAAHIVAGRLECEGVPTIVQSSGAPIGVGDVFLWVPHALLHRARWLMSWPFPGEAELTYLSTGELQPEEAR